MEKDYATIKKRRIILLWGIAVLLALICLVVPEYFTLIKENRVKAYKASGVLLIEIEQIISTNQREEENLDAFLQKTYINKAKTVSVMLDSMNLESDNVRKLRNLAKLVDVDEINIFDETGKIYMSTNPDFVGITMDAGEQIGYFKPMLEDRNLSMCQDISESSYGNRNMLYSMCWNREKTEMIQVGDSEESFPDILQANQSENIVNRIPTAAGTEILLTDIETGVILSATDTEHMGQNVADLGIQLGTEDFAIPKNFKSGTKENPIYCSVKDFNEYRIVIAQYRNVIDADVPMTVATFAQYLMLVFAAVSVLLNFMYNKILEEKNWALKDQLTDLFNRREYENTLEKYSKTHMESNLIFVSMDVNGLKNVNDYYGHSVGDQFLQGAASCISKCFDPYGKTFRYGGDEFVAIIYAEKTEFQKIISQFNEELENWSVANQLELHISVGAASVVEYPHADIYKLANLADQKMYHVKAAYYSNHENSRRTNLDEKVVTVNESVLHKNGKYISY